MKIENVLIPTAVATPDMLIRDVFSECVRAQVPAIPYRDENGELVGRVSLMDTLRKSCIPEFMVEMADVLGDQMSCVEDAEKKAREVLCHKAEEIILPDFHSLPGVTSMIKTLAVMEKHNTNYVFIIDDGVYKGVVTILTIARRMVELDKSCGVP